MLKLVKNRKEKVKAAEAVELRHIRVHMSWWQKVGFGLIILSLLMGGLRDGLEFFGFLGVGEFIDWLHPTTDTAEPPAPADGQQ